MRFSQIVTLAFLTVFGLALLSQSIVFGESPESFNLPSQQILPGDPNYVFKRFKEKITDFFKFSPQAKFEYRQIILEKRLSELVSLIEKNNQDQIANASQRFAYQAGVLVEGSPDKKEEINPLIAKYKPVLEKMRDKFPANSPFWLLTQQDIDTLNILSSKLK